MLPKHTLIMTSDSKPRRTFKEWVTAFIENDEEEEARFRAQMYRQRAEEDEMLGASGDAHEEGHDDGYYDDMELDIDESLLEGLIIFTLAATLLVLIYIRQQRNRQRPNGNGADNQGAQGNADDRGFFPRPGEPEFNQWVAGGIGH